jgi:hypothetical protein
MILAGVTDGKATAAAMKSATTQMPTSAISITSSASARRIRVRFRTCCIPLLARAMTSHVSASRQSAIPICGSMAMKSAAIAYALASMI